MGFHWGSMHLLKGLINDASGGYSFGISSDTYVPMSNKQWILSWCTEHEPVTVTHSHIFFWTTAPYWLHRELSNNSLKMENTFPKASNNIRKLTEPLPENEIRGNCFSTEKSRFGAENRNCELVFLARRIIRVRKEARFKKAVWWTSHSAL